MTHRQYLVLCAVLVPALIGGQAVWAQSHAAPDTAVDRPSAVVCKDARAPRTERLSACNQQLAAGQTGGGEALVQAHVARAQAYYDAGDYLSAIADYEAAEKLGPKIAGTFAEGYAIALLDQGAHFLDADPPDNARAFAYFDKAIAKQQSYYLAYSNRGLVYGRWGMHEQARADLKRAIDLAPDNPRAWAVRGSYYAMQRDVLSARADFDRAIQLNGNYARAYRARGNLFFDQQNYVGAVADYGQLVRLEPGKEANWRWRGWAQFKLKNWAAAEADFAKAVSLSRTADGYYGLGASRHNAGRYQEALAAYGTALSIQPNHEAAAKDRGQLASYVQAEAERDRRYKQCLDQQKARRDALERRAAGDTALSIVGLLAGATSGAVRDAQQMDRMQTGAIPSAPAQCVR